MVQAIPKQDIELLWFSILVVCSFLLYLWKLEIISFDTHSFDNDDETDPLPSLHPECMFETPEFHYENITENSRER